MKSLVKALIQQRFPASWLRYRAFDALVNDERSYLHTSGWMRSLGTGMPVDAGGTPVPWMNYSVVAFLRERLRPDQHLFEFGSGYSTVFYATRVASVTSVEYDETWSRRIREMLPPNVTAVHCREDIDGEYCRAIGRAGRAFDVVVVDGRDRVNCMKQSHDAVTARGVIVLDDSQRARYAEGIAFLTAHGFRALRFDGLKPTGVEVDATTVFYRPGNCFDL